ncbi:MAG: BBE domain-containing protein [Brachybacterium sp.]|nr:BBE domain-containing protein [Brachybacterium sp.]
MAAAALPGRGTSVDIHHLGGAFARVPAQSTAFPHRTARFWMTINGYWQEPGEYTRFTAFAQRAEAAMTHLGEQGEYVTFRARQCTGPLSDLIRRVYGEQTYRRLQQVKRRYDPGNLFRVNFNVAP